MMLMKVVMMSKKRYHDASATECGRLLHVKCLQLRAAFDNTSLR